METHEEDVERNVGKLGKNWVSEWQKAKRKESKGRASGGMMVAIKKDMEGHLKLMRNNDMIYVMGREKNTVRIIIPVYLSFGNWREELENMRSLVRNLKEENLMVVGDLNGRIGDHGVGGS